MSSFRKKTPSRTVESPLNIKFLRQINQYEYAVELRIMRDGVNENKWDFQNISSYYKTFAGCPILIAYIGNSIGDGHNSDTKVDFKTGERYQSYTSATAERIVGYITSGKNDIRLEEHGGYLWLYAKGVIWTMYARELVDKIENMGAMNVSAEINSLSEYEKDGILYITEWHGLGVTILGDHVSPAIPGSNIRKMEAYQKQLSEMKRYVASLKAQKGDNSEPQKNTQTTGVKKSMFVNKTLEKMLSKKFPDFKVLAYSEDGNRVCLMSKDSCEMFGYAFEDSDKGEVIAERIKPVTLSSTVDFGGSTLTVSAGRIYDELTERNNNLNGELERANKKINSLEERIDTMNSVERSRRIKASKAAAIAQLSEINASRDEDEKIEEACINEVIEAAEKGGFVDCENENCEWTGDEKACSAVRDIAMKRQMEMDRERLIKRNNAVSKNYVFEKYQNSKSDSGDSLEALYNRLVNKNKGVNK